MIKMYNHGGSLNHGCEAIVRSTKKIIGENIELWSMNPQLDKKYGIQDVVDIKYDKKSTIGKMKEVYMKVNTKITGSEKIFCQQEKDEFYKYLNKQDICLSIGGDLYCYAGVEKLYYIDQKIKSKKANLVLWGCSIEPETIEKNIYVQKSIKQFDLIIARETFSYNAIKKYNKNVMLFPDPAFQLDIIEPTEKKVEISSNTIGINLSPLIYDYELCNGRTKRCYEKLIEYILEHTDCNIALIPHVVYEFSDDRKPLKELYDKYAASGRIVMVEDCNCCELKWYISKCRFIVTARTHVSIAAYSTCVPTLVVGYSVKSKGIAKDIFGEYENYVIPVDKLDDDEALVEQFKWLMKNENKVRSHLEVFIPEYSKKSLDAKNTLKLLNH